MDFGMGLVLICFSILVYFVPTIVAFYRAHPNTVPILLLNAFLGWTGLGWIGALIWAAMAIKDSRTGPTGYPGSADRREP